VILPLEQTILVLEVLAGIARLERDYDPLFLRGMTVWEPFKLAYCSEFIDRKETLADTLTLFESRHNYNLT
jgi:hypothetical protein